MTGSSALPGKGADDVPSRTIVGQNEHSASTSPSSQLTPEASSSDNSAPAPGSNVAGGRGPSLAKLQTDLTDYEEPQDTTGRHTTSDSLEFGPRSEDEDEEEYYDIYADQRRGGRGPFSYSVPVSRSYTAEEEQRVVRKFDRRLTLFVAFLYMLAFLDRSNIGNAKIAGLTEDLRLSSSQYEWVLSSFYATYIVFEWMALMYRLVPPHIYISLCCLAWGLFASFQCLVTAFWPLVLLRALLGTAEAAFAPGLPFYLSFFYKREEQAFRTGLVVSAAPLATSFAGSLAWLIVWLSRKGPVAPWRMLFLIEGFPSVLVAVLAWMWIPDSPGKAWYLTPRERKVAKLRLKDGQKSSRKHIGGSGFDRREIWRTIRDPKAYLTALMFFSCNVAFSSLPVFLPTILKDMGYAPLSAQALSAPPYLVSFFVVLLTASLSDRTRTRSTYIILHAVLSATSYLLIAIIGYFHPLSSAPSLSRLVRYLAVYPAAAGFFSAITLIITWTMDNQRAKEGKGTGMALLNLIGQCGPLVGARLYPEEDGPYYVGGMSVCAAAMGAVAVLAWGLRVLLQRENERAERAAQRAEQGGRDVGHAEAERLMGGESSRGLEAGEKRAAERFTYII